MAITIWHNPRCSKSRQTLELLRKHDIEPVIVKYLDNPPDDRRIEEVLDMLGMEPRDLMRKNETPYKTLDLANPDKTREELVNAMAQHPILIQRPVVIADGKAAIGRPPEDILAIV